MRLQVKVYIIPIANEDGSVWSRGPSVDGYRKTAPARITRRIGVIVAYIGIPYREDRTGKLTVLEYARQPCAVTVVPEGG